MTQPSPIDEAMASFSLEAFFRSLPQRVAGATRFNEETSKAIYSIAKRIVFRGEEPTPRMVEKRFGFSREKSAFLLEHTRVLIRRELVALEGQDLGHFAWNGRFCDVLFPKGKKP